MTAGFDGRGKPCWEPEYFLTLAYQNAAHHSDDPVTQNGAVLVSPDNQILGHGANCFPCGVTVLPERLERPIKYSFMEHAERNAIFDAARQGLLTAGATIYCPYVACADCARAIVQAGVVRVVGDYRLIRMAPDHWRESIDLGDTILREAGVIKECIEVSLGCESILFNGEEFQP